MNATVLIVDDEDKVRSYLARLLQKRGYEVHAATDGAEALAMLTQRAVDIVLLDVLMPGASGIDVLPEIKRLQPEAEVIMLTGNASGAIGVEGIRRGAFDYLLKPIDLTQLLQRMTAALEHRLVSQQGISALDIPELR